MRFGVYDLETYGLGGAIAGIGAYNGKGFKFFDSISDLLDYFKRSKINIWYAHNGGKYDVKYLIDEVKSKYYNRYMLINGSLNLIAYSTARTRRRKSKVTGDIREYREMKGLAFELRDSILILPDSLKNLSYAFDVEHKKQEYTDYMEHKDKELMKEYLAYDCYSLYEILDKYQNELGFNKLWTTTASTAINVFKKKFDGSQYLKILGKNKTDYRKGYYGGRCEVFKRFGKDLHYYDVNSLYPSVMINERYPFGHALYSRDFKRDKIGYYHVTVTCPDDLLIPLLPYRHKSGKLLFPTGSFSGWYYSPELLLAEKLGYKIKIHEGYVWAYDINPFEDYVKYYYDIKRNAVGVKRYMAKLLLNSLYGKFAQKEEGTKLIDMKDLTLADIEEQEIYTYPNEKDIAYVKCRRYGDFIKPQLSGFVTCYSRCKLYNYMLKVGLENVYYCDTDSIVTNKPLDTGMEIGQMKEEHRIREGVFLLPKVYAFLNDRDEYIIKAKGLSSEKLGYDDYMQALKGDYSRIRSEIVRVTGINQHLRGDGSGQFYDTMILSKQIHGIFNKRILDPDGIHTYPLKIIE